MLMFENDVALVTGASRGIGHAIALALGAAGARVIGTATSAAGAEKLGADLAAHGYQGRGAVLDAGNPASIDALVSELESAGDLPTVLVNNAAITRDMLLLRMKAEDWDAVIATNLTAVFRLTKLCLRRMMKERRGRIVNITSIVGLTGNAVAPGFIDTDMTRALTDAQRSTLLGQIPLARLGTAAEVAATVLFLC